MANDATPRKPTRLEQFESLAKALGALFVPVVIGIAGFVVKSTLDDQALAQDYVRLATEILREPPGEEGESQPLRRWAADLLAEHSPVELPPGLHAALVDGGAELPRPIVSAPQSWNG